jgi:hypothetical protein
MDAWPWQSSGTCPLVAFTGSQRSGDGVGCFLQGLVTVCTANSAIRNARIATQATLRNMRYAVPALLSKGAFHNGRWLAALRSDLHHL